MAGSPIGARRSYRPSTPTTALSKFPLLVNWSNAVESCTSCKVTPGSVVISASTSIAGRAFHKL